MISPKRGLSCGGIFILALTSFLCLTFGLFAQFYGIDGPSAQDGEIRAAPILSALDEYKKDNGSYPAELDLLSPSYLSSIPRPAWRWPYAYEYELRKDEFILSFMQGRNLDGDYCGYSSQAKEWRCADSMRPY